MSKQEISLLVALAGLALTVFICLPLFLIWSLNVLFALGIPISIKTWLASLILIAAVNATNNYRRKS